MASQLVVGSPAVFSPQFDDLARVGTTGALVLGANVIACATIRSTSEVNLAIASLAAPLLAGAAAAPAIASIQPGVSFTITALAAHVGSTYSYSVVG
jgi:hypothetical protein